MPPRQSTSKINKKLVEKLEGYSNPATAYANGSDPRHGTVKEVDNNGHKQAIIQWKNLKIWIEC